MLVLSQKEGQVIKIGKDIWVQVVKIRRGQVRLAFLAPAEVRIQRREIMEQDEQAQGLCQARHP